jgi:hypothetical protein
MSIPYKVGEHGSNSFVSIFMEKDLSALFNDVQIDRDVIKAINSGYDADIQDYLRILEASDQTAKELINLKNL